MGRIRSGGTKTHVRVGRIFKVAPLVVAGLAGAAMLVMPSVKSTTTCVVISNVGIEVTATGPGTITISRDAGLLGAPIRVNGTPCGTLATVDTVSVRATGGIHQLIIDQTNGGFVPGLTPETTGTSEIEFDVDLGDADDSVTLVGGSAADKVNVGSTGINVNFDNDGDDIKSLNVESVVVDGRAGDDIITGQGGLGSGTASTTPLTLTGGTGDDNLTGGSAGDTLQPGVDNDIVNGGEGINTVDYSDNTSGVKVNLDAGTATGHGTDALSNVQNVTTGSGADEVWDPATPQRNTFTLGDGNDLFHSNALRPSGDDPDPLTNLSDRILGQGGTDTSEYINAPHNSPGLTFDLPRNKVTGSDEYDENDNENFIGSGGDDTAIDEDGQRNDLRMGDGDDFVQAGAKKPGNDAPDANGHSDNFDGGAGNDTVSYENTEHNSPGVSINFLTNKVNGSPEYDTIPGIENADGSTGDDTCTDADGERNVCRGGEGDDRFEAGVAKPVNDAPDENGKSDTWDGGPGNDTVSYENTEHNSPGVSINFLTNKVNGSPEYDEIPGVENAEGSGGDDTCVDQDGERNSCSMGEGDDTVIAGVAKPGKDAPDENGKSDSWDGGPGNNTLSYEQTEHNSPGVTINQLAGKVFGSPQFDAMAHFNRLIGSGGADILVSDPTVETIFEGLADNDEVQLSGPVTNGSRFLMGEGVDKLNTSSMTAAAIDVNMPANTVTADGSVPDYFDGEDIDNGASGAQINVVADDNDNVLQGGGGDDTLNGAGGNDTIRGGGGNDVIDCGTGTADVVSWEDSPNPVTVTMSDTPGSGTATGYGNDSFSNCEQVVGSHQNDHLVGGDANDSLHGSDGDDLIEGNNGNDSLYGDAGNDRILGGNNNDEVFGGDGDDFIDGENAQDTIHGGAGNDQLHGGSNGADIVYGDDGDDSLFGENGPDTLDGGAGNDTLDGGEGPDSCIGETKTNCES